MYFSGIFRRCKRISHLESTRKRIELTRSATFDERPRLNAVDILHTDGNATNHVSEDSDNDEIILDARNDFNDVSMENIEEDNAQGCHDTEMEEDEAERSIVPRGSLDGSNGSPVFRSNAMLQFSENGQEIVPYEQSSALVPTRDPRVKDTGLIMSRQTQH